MLKLNHIDSAAKLSIIFGIEIKKIKRLLRSALTLVPQISQMNTDFFDLSGQIYADYLRTYAVPLVGVYVWVGVKGVYKNFCIYIVRKR